MLPKVALLSQKSPSMCSTDVGIYSAFISLAASVMFFGPHSESLIRISDPSGLWMKPMPEGQDL